MRARRWMFVAVLALGVALHGSAVVAEGPGASQCQAPALALGKALGLDPVEPMFLSCSAQANCWNSTTVSCNVGSGSCTGVDSSCPGQNGYVQCGSTFISCPTCPPGPGEDCVQSCTVNSDCTSHCAGPGACVSGCVSNKPYIKKCVCIA